MITPEGWLTASNSQGNCIGARRVTRSTDIQVCETDYPDHIVQVSIQAWGTFLGRVRDGLVTPLYATRFAIVVITDEIHRKDLILVTSVANWRTFIEGVHAGTFDELPFPPVGLAHGVMVS